MQSILFRVESPSYSMVMMVMIRPSTKATKDIKPGEKDNNENLVVQSLTFHVSFYFFKYHGELLLQKNVHVCK